MKFKNLSSSKVFTRTAIILACSIIMLSCGKSTPKPRLENTYRVQVATVHKALHFTGTVQPLHESTLTSPVDAVIDTMHYHYGQKVEKNQTIFTLNSADLQRQYNDTLTDYLKAKDNYSIARAKFSGTQELWRAGLLSKNNYLSEKSSVSTARVTLIQATRKLSELFEKTEEGQREELSNLSLAEFDKVRSALTRNHNLIHVKSPTTGILLYPPKSSDERSTRLSSGASIKTGQVLGLIGDLSGISIEIDIPEVDISSIKTGMQATIRGVAFGRQELKGELIAVNAQASTSNANALPSFTAIIEVHSLTKEQQAWIKVGMSAAIELVVENENKILLPIAAVKQEAGQNLVQIRTSTGKIITQSIVTGMVEGQKVVVDSGLKVGDEVVYG